MNGRYYTILLVMETLCLPIATLSEEVTSCPAAAGSGAETNHVYWQNSKQTYISTRGKEPKQGSSFRTDPRFKGVYTFPVEKVPRMDCFDQQSFERIENGLPVILEGCSFASSTLKWSIQYLIENLRDEGHGVKISPSRQFLYYSDDLIKGEYRKWKPPTESRYVYFHEFVDIVKELKKTNNGSRAYFMSVLFMDEEGLSSNFTEDVDTMDYQWLIDLVNKFGWGMEVTNMLIVGMHDVVTPAHIDILENLFLQISGYKRCILFSPEYFHSLYPFPVGHPHDRQTQVNFDDPDFEKFPRFRDIRGQEAIVGPGDVLYIPQYWWHHIESEKNNMTVSLNFWFDPANNTKENSTSEGAINSNEEENSNDNKNTSVKSPEELSRAKNSKLQRPRVNSTNKYLDKNLEQDGYFGLNNLTGNKRQKKLILETKSSNGNRTEEEITPKTLSPVQQIALLREIEMKIFKATMDHEKVRKILEELLQGRFDFLDESKALRP